MGFSLLPRSRFTCELQSTWHGCVLDEGGGLSALPVDDVGHTGCQDGPHHSRQHDHKYLPACKPNPELRLTKPPSPTPPCPVMLMAAPCPALPDPICRGKMTATHPLPMIGQMPGCSVRPDLASRPIASLCSVARLVGSLCAKELAQPVAWYFPREQGIEGQDEG